MCVRLNPVHDFDTRESFAVVVGRCGQIKDPSIRGKHAVVTKESLLGYLRMSRCPFRGGEALLAAMFHEADFRCTGQLLPDDLKAALTERFVFRKHNGDWRVRGGGERACV